MRREDLHGTWAMQREAEWPVPLEIEDARCVPILAVDGGSQYISIEMARAVKVADHQQVGEGNSFCGKFGLRHYSPPQVVQVGTCDVPTAGVISQGDTTPTYIA